MQFFLNCGYEALSSFSINFLSSFSLPDNFFESLSMFFDIWSSLNYYIPLDIYASLIISLIAYQVMLFIVSANLQLF